MTTVEVAMLVLWTVDSLLSVTEVRDMYEMVSPGVACDVHWFTCLVVGSKMAPRA